MQKQINSDGVYYYMTPGETRRDIIPKDTIVEIIGSDELWSQISGQDPNPWRGKWVKTEYLSAVAPPGPTPAVLEIAAYGLPLVDPATGDMYTNRDKITLFKVA